MNSLDVSPASVGNVARQILAEAGAPVSTMKLQKLCYFAQGWTLAWTNGLPLFEEDFQAWRDGPVCYELFRRHQGRYAVARDDIPESGAELKSWQMEMIKAAIQPYLPLTGAQLSGLTHEEGTPWAIARSDAPPRSPSREVISKESIMDFFRGLMAPTQAEA